jgi:tetratricopeptide (TPR) repeat protein
MPTMNLPERPADRTADAVAAWAEPVVIPTYPEMPPDRNPMFLEKRVYQGSSGRIYPNPFTDRISDERRDVSWEAIHLENEFVRLMVLPQLGGRIHVGRDRTNDYDFFYLQPVIKPALVGLLGPWISGGVEFNWPQHHRPSTYMPTDWTIEGLPDGGRTIWLSEHEPMNRMKGMHGVTLRPGSAIVELRVRLFNRTPLPQTFLWWANAAAQVHDRYQSFFPPDVTYVADHARRAMSAFPVSRGLYYGVDYGDRTEADADLRWYRNIPVPTSYMAMGTRADFFGGYDHAAEAGFVHWADHRISPGKKQWTWGNAEFGQAWDRELTDGGGPYVELMAGVFTDNQPDFSFLAPYETREFSEFWYPIRAIGPAHAATLDVAASLTIEDGLARVGVSAPRCWPNGRVILLAGERTVFERQVDLGPVSPFLERVSLPAGVEPVDVRLVVEAAGGRPLVQYTPPGVETGQPPEPAVEPPLPAETATVEGLYLTGLHLEQYRHATRLPEDYWREAVRRDPGDARSNAALGAWHLRRGELAKAELRLQAAIARLTGRNPNPRDGEPFYLLGETLRHAGRSVEADEAFAKAEWNAAWYGPAAYARAQLAAYRGDRPGAIAILDRLLGRAADHTAARVLRAAIARRADELARATADLAVVLAADPLDAWALNERRLLFGAGVNLGDDGGALLGPPGRLLPGGVQTALDVAHDYAAAGLIDEAIELLRRYAPEGDPGAATTPLARYTLAWLLERAGSTEAAAAEWRCAAAGSPDYCFPARLEEIEILVRAQAANPDDARAPYYLGNLLYDRRRYAEAIHAWRRSVRLDPSFATVHRNLGIAEYNVLRRPRRALRAYRRAFAVDPTDARVLYELDQLRRRLNVPLADRLAELDAHPALVAARDDLTVERLTLLNLLARHEAALEVLLTRRFHPWEGGEGLVSGQWVAANLGLARAAINDSRPGDAAALISAGRHCPANLGEARHPLTPDNELDVLMGQACRAAGDDGAAVEWFERGAALQGDPLAPLGEPAYWRAMAMRELGDEAPATKQLKQLLRAARRARKREVRIDYFATSLPTFLVFEDDANRRNVVDSRYLEGLALAGLGRQRRARAELEAVLAVETGHAGARRALAVIDASPRPTP